MSVLLPQHHPELLACLSRLDLGEPEEEHSSSRPDWTPLHWFAVSSKASMASAQARVMRGADPSARDVTNGDTPLHLAAWARNAEKVEFLLALGANPNVPNAKGHTPLHQVIRRCSVECAYLMMEQGDWSCCDRDGLSVLGHAVQDDFWKNGHDRLWAHLVTLPDALWKAKAPLYAAKKAFVPWEDQLSPPLRARLLERRLQGTLESSPSEGLRMRF